jgi:O-antigen/teichoic acid export membrane protein
MFLKHGVIYLVGRGLPGAILFFSIILYTRLLSPDDYGMYALVVTLVGFANTVFFWWLGRGLLRFLPVYEDRPEGLLSTVATSYAVLVVLTGVIGVAAGALFSDSIPFRFALIAIGMLWVQSWYEINLELVRIRLSPTLYAVLLFLRASMAVALGVAFIYLGLGAMGVLLGLFIGQLLPGMWQAFASWRQVRPRHADGEMTRQLLKYGVPLAMAFALTFVIAMSDRVLLGWLLDTHAVGIYSAGYDLAQQTLGLLTHVVFLAAYPLVLRALEKEGEDAAREKLSESLSALLAIGLPATAGLTLLAPNIVAVVLGAEFREQATLVVPWIAVSTLIASIKIFHFDLAFTLSRNTIGQVWVGLVAAGINVGLNLWWIPTLGVMGAAYSTFIAYSVGMVGSWLLGARVFSLPSARREDGKIAAATVIMAGVLWLLRNEQGLAALAWQIGAGIAVYGGMMVALDVLGIRSLLLRALRNRIAPREKVGPGDAG